MYIEDEEEVVAVSFMEGDPQVIELGILSDMSWEIYLRYITSGVDDETALVIWEAPLYTDHRGAIGLDVIPTESRDVYILNGTYLKDTTDDTEWEDMSDADTARWLGAAGIRTGFMVGGGVVITLSELLKIPNAIARMKDNFVRKVILGSL